MKKSVIIVMFLFMALKTYAQQQVIRLATKELSLVMAVTENNELLFHHFGSKIIDDSPYIKKKSYRRADYGTDPQVYSTAGSRNFREPALRVTHSNGDLNTELVYVSHTQIMLKDENVQQTIIKLKDKVNSLHVSLHFKAFQKENVITQSVEIKNEEGKEVVLHNYYSTYLPIKASGYYLNSFNGSWAREMFLEETRLTHGIKSIESKKNVRTTHTENPSFLLSLNAPLNENHGEVIAGALAWSGNYKLNFELDEFNTLNISAGINPYASQYHLKSGSSFFTPEMVITYSSIGAGGASRNLHDWARNYQVYDPKTIRPTLLNSWEGAYFKFDEKIITDMIDNTADMGLEMFVLDDGWFGNNYPRNNTSAGLGDWQVNKTKLPRGINYLADYAVKKGLKFGIWIEPEMVNPQSDLAKKHPDWIVKANGREISTMRQQWLLDLSNPKVQEFVFKVFDETMKLSPHISYIKWDANRHVETPGSNFLPSNRQSHFWVEYVMGLYKVYELIRQKYPNVIIQACSSGGGRVEYGALKFHQEVWTSDNTDALSRVYIQYGTNLIYPALVSGSHVSAVPNHQTNLITPLKFRFDMAMTGRLGMELQPKDMSNDDKTFTKMAIANYKQVRDIAMYGDLYRINSPYDGTGYYSLIYVDKSKTKAVVYGFCINYQGRTLTPKFRLNGLDPNKNYSIKELNVVESKFWGNGEIFSGQYLINEGINPPLQKVFDSGVYLIEEIGTKNKSTDLVCDVESN